STGPSNPGNNGDVFVRFASQASLPGGNGGATAYLMANRYSTNATSAVQGRSGYLFTGSGGTASSAFYHLNTGYKFVINGAANTPTGATIGSALGNATLENTAVALLGSGIALNSS